MNPAEFANIARTEETFWWYRGMEQILFGVLDRLSSGRAFGSVLEGGCGTGFLAKRIQDRYRWPVHALDLGAEGLDFARRKYGLTRLVQGDLARLPFADSSFDLVLSMDVIVHFPRGSEQTAFNELARVLAPGGLCVVRVSALDWLRSRHSQFAAERQRFTRPRLIRQLEQAGLRVERCTYLNSAFGSR
jgi:ubiquinone/menaquinone biosynthesis C-methylase UbiE